MFKAIPGQTAGPNWIKKFNETHGFFKFYYSKFDKIASQFSYYYLLRIKISSVISKYRERRCGDPVFYVFYDKKN